MADPYLLVCFVLLLASAVTRWLLTQELRKLRHELAELTHQKQKAIAQRQQAELALEYVQVQEKELLHICWELSKVLAEILAGIKKLENIEKRVEKARKKDII
ncbi:MAG: hypothetical protein IT369_11825 [Candidatus Latescibacteria bacterium]|nr:hypothetical protein [Candidatus Latescibacterota bacterium]